MQLLKANIDNFLILSRAEIELNKQGLVLVLGYNQDGGKSDSNGVGKSSIFEAICWCLYGQTYKGLKFDDVVSQTSPGGTKVEVDLVVGKDTLKVVRHRGHTKGKNKLHIFINGKNRTPFKQSDAEILLGGLLPLSFSAFKHVIYFGQKMGETFLSLNDVGRKQLLEELIGLDVFSKAEKRVKLRLKELKAEVGNLEGSRDAYQSAISSYTDEIADAESRKKLELETLTDERSFLKHEVKRLNRAKDSAVDEEDELKELVDIFNQQKDVAETELRNREQSRGKWMSSHLLAEQQVLHQKSRILDMESLDAFCPTCEQDVDDLHVDVIVDGLKQELDHYSVDLLTKDEGYQSAAKQFEDAREMFHLLRRKIDSIDLTQASYNIHTATMKCQVTEAKVEALDKREADLQASTEALRRTLVTTKGNLADVKAKLSKIYDELPYLEFWEKGFSATGVRSMILDDVITYLNARMNHHSNAISDGEIAIELSSQTTLKSGQVRDKMSVVASTGGAGYIAASGGQQRRMDLAVHFALSDLTATVTGHKMNLLVCDEVLDCIDESGTDAILNMLEEKADAGMSVFLISHSDALKNRIDGVLLATRNSSNSTVERIS